MIKTNTKMSLHYFHDFYYLQAISAGITNEVAKNPERQFSRAVEKLQRDLEEVSESIVPNLAYRTFVYLYAACMGEARHSHSTLAENQFIPQIINQNRETVYFHISRFRPDKHNLDILVKVFGQKWRGGYGGTPWQNIAKALKLYFTVPPATFIDHVIDLEHNGGCVFNKSDANKTLFFDVRYGRDFKEFLSYKFRDDILTTSPHATLYVTPAVYKLLQRYCTIFRVKEPYWVQPELRTLDTYVVEWQDEHMTLETKWHAWASTGNINEPTYRAIIALLGIYRVYTPKHTAEQLTALHKKFKAEAKKIFKKYNTKFLEKTVNHTLDRWLASALKHCKAEKAKVTYSILPCIITPLATSFVVSVNVPYENIGTETKDGFTVFTPMFGIGLSAGEHTGHLTLDYGSIYLHTERKMYSFPYKPLEAILE